MGNGIDLNKKRDKKEKRKIRGNKIGEEGEEEERQRQWHRQRGEFFFFFFLE